MYCMYRQVGQAGVEGAQVSHSVLVSHSALSPSRSNASAQQVPAEAACTERSAEIGRSTYTSTDDEHLPLVGDIHSG